MSDLELTAYRVSEGPHFDLEPAPLKREWIDLTDKAFARRCLPLMIANQHGWWVRNDVAFRALYLGGHDLARVVIEPLEEFPAAAESHFGSGILTFSLPWIFRTPPGWNLHVGGPANYAKDGIAPLEGIVETDWATATFTMNWRFLVENTWVRFERGEPICQLTPVRRGDVELFQPVERPVSDDPELEAVYRAWGESRDAFNASLKERTNTEEWQGHYHRGQSVDGTKAPEHQTRLHVKPLQNGPAAADGGG